MSKDISSALSIAKQRASSRISLGHVRLNEGASLLDLIHLEAVLGTSVPSEVRALLSINDGDIGPIGLLGTEIYLLSARDIVRYISELRLIPQSQVERVESIPVAVIADEIALFETLQSGKINLFDAISRMKRFGFDNLPQMILSLSAEND